MNQLILIKYFVQVDVFFVFLTYYNEGIFFSESNNEIEIIENTFYSIKSEASGGLTYLQQNNLLNIINS